MSELVISKEDLARNLLAYGEAAAAERVRHLSAEQLQRVYQIAFKHALARMHFLQAGCLAAIEVIEGAPRALKRKRRVWADAPEIACEPNPRFAEIQRRFQRYAGGRRVRKQEILNDLGESLAPCLPGFRYYRTRAQFRQLFADGVSIVGLEYGHGVLSLRFGVTHDRVEEVRGRLFALAWKGSRPFPVTMSKLTTNMGPSSPHWLYPTECRWPISGSDGLALASREIAEFVEAVVLPYVISHREPAAVRQTLLNFPGRADSWMHRIETTVFAVDYLLSRRDWLDQDYADLCDAERVRASAPPKPMPFLLIAPPQQGIQGALERNLETIKLHYEAAVARWNS